MVRNRSVIGLLKTDHEEGERRDFPPNFVHSLIADGWKVVLEVGYGSKLDFSSASYQKSGVEFAPRYHILKQPFILTLRYPTDTDVLAMKPNTVFISMMHFPTRPSRVDLLNKHHIKAIALDQITDFAGTRLVENLKSVAWNGFNEAVNTFFSINTNHPKQLRVTVIGSGSVGKHAVEAAIKLGGHKISALNIPVVVCTIGRNVTSNKQLTNTILKRTHILADASQRTDTSKPIIDNHQLKYLPKKSVVLDLSVDPYVENTNRIISTKGVEGIPQGNLSQWIFAPKDPAWNLIPQNVPHSVKRTVVSCYSWPGIKPVECMTVYANQLIPLLKRLQKVGFDKLSIDKDYFSQALYKGSLAYFLSNNSRV